MKVTPLIFSGQMVRALLDGTKTQTRRIVKPQPRYEPVDFVNRILGFKKRRGDGFWIYPNGLEDILAECPYGLPGDLIWVRETWGPGPFYRADIPDESPSDGWRPSIHMPRWASRLTLRLTDVRVQRVQGISCADAIAEGIEPAANSQTIDCDTPDPRQEFSRLWLRINGAGAWAANPWVWALTFEVIKANVDKVLKEAA